LIYKKSLTLSPTKSSSASLVQDDDGDGVGGPGEQGSSGFDNGSIVNIMSEDTNNIMMFFSMAHFIWAIPLKVRGLRL
jgi:hypothetical protein